MSNQRWQQIESLFDGALERPEEERLPWLAEACSDDPGLRSEVEQMLLAHMRAEGVLEKPVEQLASDLMRHDAGLRPEESVALSGEKIGPYELLCEIGRGGMGVVYRVRDPRLDRFVALKFLPAHLRTDSEARRRFLAEAQAASALDHPNICTIYDIGDAEDGRHFIAMAHYDGETLERKIDKGPMPIEDSVAIALQIAEGLGRAHEAGIIHRDIKPSNVMVTSRGEVKILDFGIAKLEGSTTLTEPGTRVGTIAYMSPEQAQDENVDQRTDLWSLGVVLYEMVAGRRPFMGNRMAALLNAILHKDPPPLRTVREEAPEALERILMKALAKRPGERYSTAAEMLEEIHALAGGAPSDRSSGNLPAPLTTFVGRKREIQQVASILSEARLLTLTGPAGTGKTRLSLEVARESAMDYEDGAHFVPLTHISDPSLVPSAIAHALDLVESSSRPTVDSLKDALRGRQLLFVLDNFEQVVGAAPVVAELLETCPRLKIIVTSRVVLRVSGEHAFSVPPLDLPDPKTSTPAEALSLYSATALFVERARVAHPAFKLTDKNAQVVAEICARLDGMPLAIELAAARIKLLSPQDLLARLGQRLDLLKAGPRDRPARHQTLRQAIAWSYDLLNEDERILFRRLAVFLGGFSLAAAEEVGNHDGSLNLDVVDGVEALLDQSLLRQQEDRDGGTRFLMLETIREFGLECLEQSEDLESTRQAHAHCFLSVAEQAESGLTGPEQGTWFDQLDAGHDNLRAALSWAEERADAAFGLRIGAALWRFWVARGHLEEGRHRLEKLLAMPSATVPTAVRARALNGIGTVAHNQGDNAQARSYLEESLQLFRRLDDRRGVAVVLNNLAWVACELSDLDVADSLSKEALTLNRGLGEKRGVAVALNNLGWVANYRGEYQEARSYHEQSLSLRREIGDQRGTAFALANLAWAEQYHGDYDRGLTLINEATEILRAVNDNLLMGFARLIEGAIAYDQGAFEPGETIMEESFELWMSVGNRSGNAWAMGQLGAIVQDLGDHARAERLQRDALSLWEAVGCRWGIATTQHRLGGLAMARGHKDRAMTHLRESLHICMEIGDKRGIADGLDSIAKVAAERGELETATRLLGASSTLRDSIDVPVPRRRLEDYRQSVDMLEKGLGDSDFSKAWSEGMEMTPEQAVRFVPGSKV
jgi:non-specific serine/threonine protein kinase